MSSSWKESQQSDPHRQDREHQSAIITIHTLLSDNATTPEQAARDITSSYEPRLLAGKTDLCSLWYLIMSAILHPETTDQDLETLVEMLVHMSRSPDVVVDGKIIKENGREYWHDLPELSFWFMEYAMSESRLASCRAMLCTNITNRRKHCRKHRRRTNSDNVVRTSKTIRSGQSLRSNIATPHRCKSFPKGL